MPKFSIRTLDELKNSLPKKMLTLTLVSLAIVLAYILIAPYIFQFLFPQYLEAIPYSQAFMLTLLFYSSILATTAMQAKKMVREMYKANVYTAIFKIISLLVFVYFFGLWGVIFARITNEAFSLLITNLLLFTRDTVEQELTS